MRWTAVNLGRPQERVFRVEFFISLCGHRNRIRWTAVNLGRLQEWVDAGRLDTGRVLTMRDLRDNGVVHKKIPHGVKLLAKARRAPRGSAGVLIDGALAWGSRFNGDGHFLSNRRVVACAAIFKSVCLVKCKWQ